MVWIRGKKLAQQTHSNLTFLRKLLLAITHEWFSHVCSSGSACSTASFVLPESSGQRDRACASVSGLDTPEAFLFKLLSSEWHRLMTYRKHVMFWISCGVCCSCSSHLDALWQHFLFIFQWYPACTAQESSEPPLASCSLCSFCWWLWQPAGCCSSLGPGLWLRQALLHGEQLQAVLVLAQLQGTALHVLPLPGTGTICLFLTATSHRPSVAQTWSLFLSLSLLQTCLEIRDVRNRSLHLFSCSSERFPAQIIHQFTFSGVENTFSYLQSPNVPIYFCTLAYLFPRLFLLISPYLFLSVK